MEAYQEIQEKFPDADSFMYGRGIIARPYLLDEIMCGTRMKKEDRQSQYSRKCASSMTVFIGSIRSTFPENEMCFFV